MPTTRVLKVDFSPASPLRACKEENGQTDGHKHAVLASIYQAVSSERIPAFLFQF